MFCQIYIFNVYVVTYQRPALCHRQDAERQTEISKDHVTTAFRGTALILTGIFQEVGK